MSAVHTRIARRHSSRLNHVANHSAANHAVAGTLPNQSHSCDMMNFNNFEQTENRVIYERPDVRLKPLPFFDLIDELIRPAGLISDGIVGRLNESQVEFKLTAEQADMIAMSPNKKQILLRFCHLDPSSEQDDNFPHEVVISVNGGPCVPLPAAQSNPNKPNIPPKRPGQHLDITKYCKLCPYVQNTVNVKWFVDPTNPARSSVITVIAAEKLDSNTLLQRVKERGLSDSESTKKLILDSDNEVATTNLQSSLVCPLGKMRMSMPCKPTTCQHITCFDALFYIQMNEKKATWTCPVCYKPAYFRDLMIDGFFMEILEQSEPSVTEVTLNSDGSWIPVTKTEQPTTKNQQPECITISDDED